MKIYIISDTHFFHYNIIEYCHRGFSDEYHMNEKIITNWNSIVTQDDVVFHLGDLSAGLSGRQLELKNIIGKLNGKIHLIRGNHDHLSEEEYLDYGIKSVSDYKVIDKTLLVHYPLDGPCTKYTPIVDVYKEIYNDFNCEYLFHGHSHHVPDAKLNAFNASVDINNFKPLLVDDIFEKVFNRNITQQEYIREQF